MRDTVKLTVCMCVYVCVSVCSSCNCSTVAMRLKLRLLATLILDFDSWICKLKLCSRIMASFTYCEGCCSLFRTVPCIICSHKFLFKV